jgi:hypothetical protein
MQQRVGEKRFEEQHVSGMGGVSHTAGLRETDTSTGNLCFESASVALRPQIPVLGAS